jgi:predicted O-methyltransferase YrrM
MLDMKQARRRVNRERWRLALRLRAERTVRRWPPMLENVGWILHGGKIVVFDYAPRPTPRFGYGKAPHPGLERLMSSRTDEYEERLRGLLSFREALLAIPLHPAEDPTEPYWRNRWQPGLDALALYGFVRLTRPRRYVEIGSGMSTKFVRRAIRDEGLTTTITSIDPQPRADVDRICDRVVRAGLEDIDLALFDALEANDVVFMDGSHRSLMNSDATVFFLEVLPRLSPGVLVCIHDICLPCDYPPDFANRWYSEQYLLAVDLLARDDADRIVLPTAYVTEHPRLRTVLDPLWQDPRMHRVARHGASMWLRT